MTESDLTAFEFAVLDGFHHLHADRGFPPPRELAVVGRPSVVGVEHGHLDNLELVTCPPDAWAGEPVEWKV